MKKTKSVILPAYNRNIIRAIISLKRGERELPDLKPDEVLVKMEAAPVNPSDIAFIRGEYNVDKPMPAVPGFEGAGIVEETGAEAKSFLGKRVSCFVQGENDGTWAEYFVAKADNCIPVKEELPVEQAACLSINPFTAYAMFELARKKGVTAIVQTAAGGRVAEFIRVFAKKSDVSVINIVRKREQVEMLKNAGEEYVLNSVSEDFPEKLKELSHDLQAKMVFDAVGGELTGILLNEMPSGSDVVVYGGLSGSEISGVDTLEVIFGEKRIYGFDLNKWIADKSTESFRQAADIIQDMIIAGELKTGIRNQFSLDDIVSAIREYIKSMSGGKVLLRS